MQTWINFWSLIFWLSIILFISNLNNLICLIFYSELIWIVLYCNVLIQGSINNDINLISSSIYILGFAGLEYSIGIILIIMFKTVNKSLNLNNIDVFKTNNNLYLNRYLWNI